MTSTILVHALGWSLLHFVWQGLLVALVAGLILSLLNRCSANIRYLVASCAMILMALCPVVSCIVLLSGPQHVLFNGPQHELLNGPQQVAEQSTDLHQPVAETNLGHPLDNSTPRTQVEQTNQADVAQADVAQTDVTEYSNVDQSLAGSGSETENSPAILTPPNENSRSLGQQFRAKVQPFFPWLVAVWLIGVVVLSVRMLGCWYRVQSIKMSGVDVVNSAISKTFEGLCVRFGISGKLRLQQTTAVAVPTVIGWVSPVVLLPLSVISELSTQQIQAILAHEIAHVRRADYLVNLVLTSIETVLFYHPAVWWLSSRIRIERENCCDDLANQVCENPQDYIEALLFLEQLKPQSTPLAVGADGASLVKRAARLLGQRANKPRHSFWLAGALSLAIAIVVGGVLLSQSAKAGTQQQQDLVLPTQEPDQASEQNLATEIKVLTLDESGNPLKGVHIHAGIWSNDRTFPPNQMGNSDENGEVTIDLPDEYTILRLWARADGYTHLYSNWEEGDIKAGDVPPDEYTFQMIKGTTIGGIIKNEQGQPIVGAKVGISASATHPAKQKRLRFGSWYATGGSLGGGSLVTDDQGRWSLDTLPPAEDLAVTVTVSHPDYIDDPRGDLAKVQAVSTAQLRDQSATIVMQEGVVIAGKLTDREGKPVTSGIVVWGEMPYGVPGSQEVRINHDGTYRLPAMAPGRVRVTVVPNGFQPDSRMVEVERMMGEVDFEIRDGYAITILVKDAKTGESVPGYVGIQQWRGAGALYNEQHPSVLDSGVPNRTNEFGVYRWSWAPEDEIRFSISAEGYTPTNVTLSASETPHTVELFRPLEIAGDVYAKETGQPIDAFTVQSLRYSDLERFPERFSEDSDRAEGRNGTFLSTPYLEGNYRFKVEAVGYKPFITEMYETGDDVPRLKIYLEKEAWVAGKVVDAGGAPVSEVQVLVASKAKTRSLRKYRFYSYQGHFEQSDDQGTFQIPPSTEPRTLVFMHDDGYAEVVLHPNEGLQDIVLQPWVSVSGTVYDQDGKPASGVRVAFEGTRYHFDHGFHIQDMTVAVSDNNGRYHLRRLPPIVGVIRPLSHMTDLLNNEQVIPVNLASAASHQVDIGKAGTLVTGQLKLASNGLTQLDYSHSKSSVVPIAAPRFGFPEMLKSANWKDGWKEVKRIQSNHSYWPARSYLYSLGYTQVQPLANGKFSFTIYEPGSYEFGTELKVRAAELGAGVFASSVGESVLKFEIDEQTIQAGSLDLGTITVQQHSSIAVGDQVPNFEFRQADGEKGQLADLQGSVVLLELWATWCEECEKDKPQLTKLADSLNTSTRMLSVECPGSGPYKRGSTVNKDRWTAAQLIYDLYTPGIEYQSLFQQLGAYSLPCYLVIDAEGKLLYRGDIDGATKLIDQQNE